MNLYIKVLKQYGDFKNRSTFKEFWQFTLFSVLITLLFTVIDISISFKIIYNFGILSVFYSIIILIPSLAVSVRRLHDVGKSGWTVLVLLIPAIGFVWLLVLLCRDTMPERNKWGENPNLRIVS
jgi:uncharacterized membrane protein YhaH (DUF805 family)